MGDGALLWASGSHTCSGNTAALTPNPRIRLTYDTMITCP